MVSSSLSTPAHEPGPVGVILPGPDRKRLATLYCYRLTYRNSEEAGAGCVRLWEVAGGRLPYQIALERDESCHLHLHCTCADAIFRAEPEGRHCKHIRGLLKIASLESEHALPASAGRRVKASSFLGTT